MSTCYKDIKILKLTFFIDGLHTFAVTTPRSSEGDNDVFALVLNTFIYVSKLFQ